MRLKWKKTRTPDGRHAALDNLRAGAAFRWGAAFDGTVPIAAGSASTQPGPLGR